MVEHRTVNAGVPGSRPGGAAGWTSLYTSLVGEDKLCNAALARRLHCVENAQVPGPYGVVKR